MIQANELRIGNLVARVDNGKHFRIKRIEDGYLENHYNEEDISGIPLTEEWMVKLPVYIPGYYEINEHIVIDIKGDIYLCQDTDTFGWITNIKFIHELQNWFFLLNDNKELTFDK